VSREDKLSFDASDAQRLAVDGVDAINEALQRLFLACQSTVVVRAYRLDQDFYFSESFTEACQSIIVRDLRNQLLFLVEDEQFVIKANSRLVALARQFSSYVKIRVLPEPYIEHQEMFVVCDDAAYLHQPSIERPKAFMSTADRGAARRLGQRFKDLWERSEPPGELFTTGL